MNRLFIEKKPLKKEHTKTDEIKIEEASAWTRKYFKEDSASREDEVFIKIGINAIMLISNPTHTIIHLEEEIVMKVPAISKQ